MNIDDELYQRLRIQCVKRKIKIKTALDEAINLWLDTEEKLPK